MPQEREEYRIGQLAKLADVKPDTVRFYERTGLLDKPRRNPNGYRSYRKATLDEIRFIRKAQSLGFSLDEVRRILGLRARAGDLSLRHRHCRGHAFGDRGKAEGTPEISR